MGTLVFRLVIFAVSVFPGFASAEENPQREKPAVEETEVEEVTVIDKRYRSPTVPRSFGSSRIRDWHAPDNRTLIIELIGREKLKAIFMSPCIGIRHTETLAFVSRGPFELDRFSSVLLPDGQRCYFSDLTVYTEEDEKWDDVEQLEIMEEDNGDGS